MGEREVFEAFSHKYLFVSLVTHEGSSCLISVLQTKVHVWGLSRLSKCLFWIPSEFSVWVHDYNQLSRFYSAWMFHNNKVHKTSCYSFNALLGQAPCKKLL